MKLSTELGNDILLYNLHSALHEIYKINHILPFNICLHWLQYVMIKKLSKKDNVHFLTSVSIISFSFLLLFMKIIKQEERG